MRDLRINSSKEITFAIWIELNFRSANDWNESRAYGWGTGYATSQTE